MKRAITCFFVLVILLCIIPSQKVSALNPPRIDKYEYSGPQDFVRWINNKSIAKSESFFEESMYQKYVTTYKEAQDYILVPKIAGATLNGVYWTTSDVCIHYQFYGKNIDWDMSVYPVKAYNKEHFPDNIVSDLEKRYRIVCDVSTENSHLVTDSITGDEYMQSQSIKKTKLKLADATVDCLQEVWRWKKEKTALEEVILDFITEGMYVQVSADGMTANKLKYITQIMSKCSFQKFYTNPGLKLNGKKNKVSRKNAVLYATLYNPAREAISNVKLYIYDKKTKRYRLVYREKIAKKNRKKQNISIKLNVKRCLKTGRKQLGRKREYPIKKRKRYRYRIRAKVGKKYYSVCSSFKFR